MVGVGCRFALDVFTVAQQDDPFTDHHSLNHDPGRHPAAFSTGGCARSLASLLNEAFTKVHMNLTRFLGFQIRMWSPSRFTNGSRRRERVFADNKHTMERGHPMCRTRHRTAFRVRERDHKLFAPRECAEKLNTCSHLTECADRSNLVPHQVRGGIRQCVSQFTECAEDQSRVSSEYTKDKSLTSQSARMNQTKGCCTARSAQTRIHTAQSARTETCSWQSLPSGDGAIYHT